MKKLLLVAMLFTSLLMLTACGNDKEIGGVTYETFGIANQESHRDPKILYEMSAGSVIVAIIFCQTIIVPVYVIG